MKIQQNGFELFSWNQSLSQNGNKIAENISYFTQKEMYKLKQHGYINS